MTATQGRPRMVALNTPQLWAIYEHPSDFPNCFVVRRWSMNDSVHRMMPDAKPWAIAGTLRGARVTLPLGLTRIPRDPSDVACIVESWA